MTRVKDMEYLSGLMEGDTLGSTWRVSDTDMEFTHGQVEQYIMVSGTRITRVVTDIREMMMAKNTMDHGRMTHDREMQF